MKAGRTHSETQRSILITAFEAFGGEEINPTERVLGMLPDALCGFALRKVLLPVEFIRARELAAEAYDKISPAAVIMLGQAGGRSAITPESTGKNRMNARIPDNAGYQPSDLPVEEGGPEALHATLPVDRITDAVHSAGIPCERSDDAGAYVCNAVLYGMLLHNGGAVPTGFIHVPYIKEQGHADKPFMELEEILRAIETAVTVVAAELNRGI